ncbi:transcriptional regulator [Streptomyces violascens]|uniref:transcriptional regulator n=1 Tax=Streptomyces violascens TaxID=67381 RepID=UPI0037A7ACC7
MIAAHQWVATTAGRIATCSYSWMQAVHWVAGSGLYTPSRRHGPKWGPTTVAIAQEISALAECRPGIAYLARTVGVSERTVQYHLDMLREAGLLVYRSKGTRLPAGARRASHFERVIPVEFDTALGIRTVQPAGAPAIERRPVGIAEESRDLIGKLARKAARKMRRKPVRGKGRCTPMQAGTRGSSPTGGTHLPSESKLDSGQPDSPAPNKQQKKAQRLNKIGRRHQLARELITAVSWLAPASSARIAWIVRHVADTGWSCHQVQAFLGLSPTPDAARRPSGLLAHRLKGAHLLWDTPDKRQQGTQAWQDSLLSKREQPRNDGPFAELGGPRRASVQRIVAEAVARMNRLEETNAVEVEAGSDATDLEGLSPDQIVDMRAAALKDPALIHSAIDLAGEDYARRLYTNRLVDQALTAYGPTTVITW